MAFLDTVRPKVGLSDRYAGQGKLAEAHQYCLAHLIRDAQYAIDAGDTIFAPAFKAFLKDACAAGQENRLPIAQHSADRLLLDQQAARGEQLGRLGSFAASCRFQSMFDQSQIDAHDRGDLGQAEFLEGMQYRDT